MTTGVTTVFFFLAMAAVVSCHQNLTLDNAHSFSGDGYLPQGHGHGKWSKSVRGLLVSWNPTISRADFKVAQDGSGTHRTINEALAALAAMDITRSVRSPRVIIYVKAGVYNENVVISNEMDNVMLVGDGIDKTTITGNRSHRTGFAPLETATFAVFGDGFWARGITFENTAGPNGHQAGALMVNADESVFYKCSIKGYQQTLQVLSFRQFYRDCQIYGTKDIIFGFARVIFQNCAIFVRRPQQGDDESTTITANGRSRMEEPTGFVIHGCRVMPDFDPAEVKSSVRNFLGRPCGEYSRTVFLKTDIDGFIDPQGYTPWLGNAFLSTLYYAEYRNTGSGASTANRVKWPGFHVLKLQNEVSNFTMRKFIQGHLWIPCSGVPFWNTI